MDRVVRHAIAQGLKPVTAIQMATLNTAQHFGLEREIGSITPGRLRRLMLIVSDLADAAHRRGLSRAASGWPRAASSKPTSRPIDYPATREEHGEARHEAQGQGFRHRRAQGRQRGAGAGDRRHREPGADARAGGRPRGRGRAGRHGPRATTSARSRWSSAIAARAPSSTASSRASAITPIAPSPRTVAHDSHHMIVVGTNKRRHGAGRQPARRGRRRRRGLSQGQGAGAGRAADRRADVGRARRDRRGQGREAGRRRCAPAAAR